MSSRPKRKAAEVAKRKQADWLECTRNSDEDSDCVRSADNCNADSDAKSDAVEEMECTDLEGDDELQRRIK